MSSPSPFSRRPDDFAISVQVNFTRPTWFIRRAISVSSP